jgi:hypothetical protein
MEGTNSGSLQPRPVEVEGETRDVEDMARNLHRLYAVAGSAMTRPVIYIARKVDWRGVWIVRGGFWFAPKQSRRMCGIMRREAAGTLIRDCGDVIRRGDNPAPNTLRYPEERKDRAGMGPTRVARRNQALAEAPGVDAQIPAYEVP